MPAPTRPRATSRLRPEGHSVDALSPDLIACGLPGGWTGQPVWSLLDTAFGQGERFLRLWHAWQDHPRPPDRLHVVALCPVAPVGPPPAPPGVGTELGQALAQAAQGLLDGMHRLILADGRVHLTLCIGDPLAALAQLHVQVDVLWLQSPDAGLFPSPGRPGRPEPPAGPRDDRRPQPCGDRDGPLSLVRGLARCARPGTRLVHIGPPEPWRAALRRCGFQFDPASPIRSHSGNPDPERAGHPDPRPSGQALGPAAPPAPHPAPQSAERSSPCSIGRFEPGWSRRRTAAPAPAVPAGRCGVIGAGLAGAAVAAALAQRGWEVEVLDRHPHPAGGASGLPAGLLAAQTSADDNIASRLSRAGVRLTLQQAGQRLTPGVDWSASGTLERLLDGTRHLPPHWPVAGHPWAKPLPGQSALWHAWGGWIRPAALVEAWLGQPGVRFRGGCAVHSLQFQDGLWHVLDVAGRELLRCDRLVLANALGLPDLLAHLPPELAAQRRPLPALQSLYGQVSWGWHTEAAPADGGWPAAPVHGHGSLIPSVPLSPHLSQAAPPDLEPCRHRMAWVAGASYEPDDPAEGAERAQRIRASHAANLDRLRRLEPAAAAWLQPCFEAGSVQTWRGVRCVSLDRLPLVGPLLTGVDSLWVSAAMGSRGLSLATLCAELLAARWSGEPLPVEHRLARALEAGRGRPAGRPPAGDVQRSLR